jgi:hypothetical protein
MAVAKEVRTNTRPVRRIPDEKMNPIECLMFELAAQR